MSNKKQTALEWYIEEIDKYNKEPWKYVTIGNKQAIIDKAKAMEKEQIAEAYYIGDKNGCGCYDYCTKEDSEQYYKETYEQ